MRQSLMPWLTKRHSVEGFDDMLLVFREHRTGKVAYTQRSWQQGPSHVHVVLDAEGRLVEKWHYRFQGPSLWDWVQEYVRYYWLF